MYESFYNLNASPFQLTPNPLFFYDSDTHRHGLIKLRQSIHNGCSITAVTGEPGTGKSELMRRFMSELDPKSSVVANIPLTCLRANNILDYIATAFGVVNMGYVGDALWSKTAFLGKVQQQISSQVGEGKRYFIFVDNAESLGKNCLKIIMQLCSVRIKGLPLVQCFLFGDTSINRNLKLDVTSLGIHNISSVSLVELEEEETRRYIEHRLLMAGWQGDPEITEIAYKLIYDISEGVPWHINLLCHRVFLQSFLEDTHVIDENIVGMFLTEEQLVSMGVSGSDVSVASNVVTLRPVFSGREMKGTSHSPESNDYTSNHSGRQVQQVVMNERDSISYFFSERADADTEVLTAALAEATEETLIDDSTISFDDVQEAFDASIEGENYFEDIPEEETRGGECVPEVSEKASQPEIPELEVEATITDVSEPAAGILKRDSVLDRILPKVKSGYDELTQSIQIEKTRSRVNQQHQQFKTYPALPIPGGLVEQSYVAPVAETVTAEETVSRATYTGRSTFQIATRASIVTSLIITLVMWVISDTRTTDTRLARSADYAASANVKSRKLVAPAPVNTATPSPFEQRDDRSRSRTILNK